MLPPVMQLYYDYGDSGNSCVYLGGAIQLILVFLLLSYASTVGVWDRSLISLGLLMLVLAHIWLLILLPMSSVHTRSNFPYFLVSVCVDLAGIPTVCDVGLALYSKLLPDRMQGLGQGSRRFISQLAMLLGPLWTTGTLHSPALMVSVPLLLLLLASLLFVCSYRWMRDGQEEEEEETML